MSRLRHRKECVLRVIAASALALRKTRFDEKSGYSVRAEHPTATTTALALRKMCFDEKSGDYVRAEHPTATATALALRKMCFDEKNGYYVRAEHPTATATARASYSSIGCETKKRTCIRGTPIVNINA